MKTIEMIFERAADFLWGDWLLFALLGLGIFYTIVTGGIQFRCIPLIARGVFKGGRKTTENDEGKNCSSYQALCAAIASCVGSGNIVGVSTAILSGGPGALFWMWFAAVFGMATKFGEITMGVRYHGKDAQGNIAGGPMYYIAKGLNWKGIGALVAILLFIQNCGATLIQSNTIAQVSGEAFRAPVLLTAVIVAVIMSLIISGGFKRLVQVAQNVSPIMAGIYIVAGLSVFIKSGNRCAGRDYHKRSHAFRRGKRALLQRGRRRNSGCSSLFGAGGPSGQAGILWDCGGFRGYNPDLQYDRIYSARNRSQSGARQRGDADRGSV